MVGKPKIKPGWVRDKPQPVASATAPKEKPPLGKNYDGRTREARLMKSVKLGLEAMLGRDPNPIETAVITQICSLTLQVALFEEKLATTTSGGLGRDHSRYLATVSALNRVSGKFQAMLLPKASNTRPGPRTQDEKYRAMVAAQAAGR